jgi:GGDEF domain-containing protein
MRYRPAADTPAMDDFRSQLTAVIDEMQGQGDQPLFLIVDLDGSDQIKQNRGAESLDQFKQSAINLLSQATDGSDAFTYGDEAVVAILSSREFDRLKTFAVIQKLRRSIPLLGQSYDCFLRPE